MPMRKETPNQPDVSGIVVLQVERDEPVGHRWSCPEDDRRGLGEALERRQRGHGPEIINISWKAQRRLNARWRQLRDARRKPGGVVAVAIARELAAYCWEIATCTITGPEPTPTPTTRQRPTNSR